MHVWIDGEFGRITVSHPDFVKNCYTLKLLQNHGVIVISSNSLHDSKHVFDVFKGILVEK